MIATEPLPLGELREVARSNGSVNVDLASHYDLRWHDPAWLAAWERRCAAANAWRATWPNVPFAEMPKGIYQPVPSLMTDPEKRAVAEEYLSATAASRALTRRFRNPETHRRPVR